MEIFLPKKYYFTTSNTLTTLQINTGVLICKVVKVFDVVNSSEHNKKYQVDTNMLFIQLIQLVFFIFFYF